MLGVLNKHRACEGAKQRGVKLLCDEDVRVEMDLRNEKLGYKIREARMDKLPYMIIVGENEQNNGTVSVRRRDAEPDKQELGEMSLHKVVEIIKKM